MNPTSDAPTPETGPGAPPFSSPVPDPRRVVVVTGGTGGLGRWVVRRFALAGNSVHVPVRDGSGSLDSARALPDATPADVPATPAGAGEPDRTDMGERIHLHACDVTDAEDVDAFVRAVTDREGRVDVVVNGVGGFAMAPVLETEPGSWRKMLEVNATSAFLCSRSSAAVMKEAGWGRIVNVASMPALEPGSPGMAAYGAAKTALVHLTRSLSEELVEDGITVNAVAPTVIDTPANRDAMPDADRERWIHPRKIADVVAFLASDAAEIVTGSVLTLSRG